MMILMLETMSHGGEAVPCSTKTCCPASDNRHAYLDRFRKLASTFTTVACLLSSLGPKMMYEIIYSMLLVGVFMCARDELNLWKKFSLLVK